MTREFDVNAYWLRRGVGYASERRLEAPYYRLQERFLIDVLRSSRIPTGRILEVGCGYGRISRLLSESFPDARITAVDLSPDQLANAQRLCQGCHNVSFGTYDLYADEPPGAGPFDVGIAIEVLLHHPASALVKVIPKLAALAGHLVNLDWSEAWRGPTAEHVWVHDYEALYAAAGLQCAAFTLPCKIEGMQQKLFIAAPRLAIDGDAAREAASRVATWWAGAAGAASEPVADGWSARVAAAIDAIRAQVPAGEAYILVDGGKWGVVEIEGRRKLPYVEHEGQYWGPPADDVAAVEEMERLLASGARYVAVAWTADWWLDHYRGLGTWLRARARAVTETGDVTIFALER